MKKTQQLITILILTISISFTNAETTFVAEIENSLSLNDFVTTWETNNQGSSNSTLITIPTTGSGYNYDVDWNNDGVFDEFGITGNVVHNFGAVGIYTIRIQGSFPRIYFNDQMDKNKIISIDQWGDQIWTSMASAFHGCSNLGGQATDSPNLSNVTNMNSMFSSAMVFNQNINDWDTSNITNMSHMFNNATGFNQDIDLWNTSNVTDMSYMFASTYFNRDINDWNTSNVSDMSYMFFNNSIFNQPIGNWNTINVNNMMFMFANATDFDRPIGKWNTINVMGMASMFENATNFNQPIGNWSTLNVNGMTNMFENATNFNQPIGNWNTLNVIDMMSMFANATSFNQPIGNWNTLNVIEMTSMFENATSFNQPIGSWNLENLVSTINMFKNATSFNQDIGNWNTSEVNIMDSMFEDAINFNQNIGSWNIANLTGANNMFTGVTLSTANYDALLIGWEAQTHNDSVFFDGGNSKYCTGEIARTNLESDGWTITDAGLDCTAGVDELVLNSIEIYPNPSKDGNFKLNWDSESKMAITVVDINGKIVLSNKEIHYSNDYLLDLSTYTSGVYFVKFYLNDKVTVKKLLLLK